MTKIRVTYRSDPSRGSKLLDVRRAQRHPEWYTVHAVLHIGLDSLLCHESLSCLLMLLLLEHLVLANGRHCAGIVVCNEKKKTVQSAPIQRMSRSSAGHM